jgi:7-cyano-7-deazaguanosine (preQ0) biosynthesis protein QueE
MKLAVNEIYGPVFQGEGPAAGERAAFLRLAGCDLSCAWCDTPYTWDWERFNIRDESHLMSLREVFEGVMELECCFIVITGGEPLLQARAMLPLVRAFHRAGCRVEIETNGTHVPPADFAQAIHRFVVSPKLANSGNSMVRRRVWDSLVALNQYRNTAWKFVVEEPADLKEVQTVVEELGIERSRVWIMPEGITREAILTRAELLSASIHGAGYNLTLRQHILLYGNRRAT